MIFQARQFQFHFPRPALIMGVVNVTPDSFYDGGRYFDPQAALDHALELAALGADIIDIGGESTRPRAAPVAEDEERRRVLPVISQLSQQLGIPISIDTQKPAVARLALEAGASMVNDIAANRESPEMWEVVAERGAGYVAMHMQGTPETMQNHPKYANVVADVGDFFRDRLDRITAAGVLENQIVLDPGIGFGKTLKHNLELLAGLKRFRTFKRPVLLGVSRKSFIKKLLGAPAPESLPSSLACAQWAVQNGAQIIRTHDVRETAQCLRTIEAILNACSGTF